jgi:hypothetical protein
MLIYRGELVSGPAALPRLLRNYRLGCRLDRHWTDEPATKLKQKLLAGFQKPRQKPIWLQLGIDKNLAHAARKADMLKERAWDLAGH